MTEGRAERKTKREVNVDTDIDMSIIQAGCAGRWVKQ